MTFDFDTLSAEFKQFYDAFSPATYGRSMGRAADHAVSLYDTFSEDEKRLATEWFLELFSEGDRYFGWTYLQTVEAMGDKRFLPLLKTYHGFLKQKHRRPVRATLPGGETVTVRPSFKTDLQLCKRVMRVLKRKR